MNVLAFVQRAVCSLAPRHAAHVAASACAVALLFTSSNAKADFDPDAHRGARVGYETGGAILGAAGGALVGGLGTLGTAELVSPRSTRGWGGVGFLLVGGLTGAFFGESAGIYLAGRWSGANGSYLPTLGAQSLGLATGVGLLLATQPDSPFIYFFALGVLPIAGGIIGYELSTKKTSSMSSTSSGLMLDSPPMPPMVSFQTAF